MSIRELIRQGYLFGAKVLVRPFTERAVTLIYLSENPADLQKWNAGWKHGGRLKRPSLKEMLEYLNRTKMKQKYTSLDGITHELNSATHGDPFSARWNVALSDSGKAVFLASKNLHAPGLADEICAETIPWLAVAMVVMSAAFGQPKPDLAIPVAARG